MNKEVNPFDVNDDINPFSQVEHYNPFEQKRNYSEAAPPPQPTGGELKFSEDYDDHASFYSGGTTDNSTVQLEENYDDKERLVSSSNSNQSSFPGSFDETPNNNNNSNNNKSAFPSSASTTVGGSRFSYETNDPSDSEYNVWQLEYYRQFFNVDSTDVMVRCLRSMWPFKYDFIASVKGNPDLYGPFWISTTLIFMMAASANFAAYLQNSETWHYDVSKLMYGSAVIYGYTFLIPTAFWIYITWVADVKLRITEVLCIYGYSLFIYSPVAILCVIPFDWLQWVVVSIGLVLSTSFLVVNLWMPLKERLAHAMIILFLITLFHIGLALTFRLYFFLYTAPSS
eukprot:TRINITY_DN1360_c0_g1_i1.p2 TRINITY_DN1360_c0_g1~~TRINITY_DN1360_c0_g1_i1.p2  ORF type:complete len:341 (-),score=75.25 TRINITY_DN1360_c0_g1_i1:124-1146(-)